MAAHIYTTSWWVIGAFITFAAQQKNVIKALPTHQLLL